MKITTNDALAILQMYHQADDAARSRMIDQLRVTHPTEHTTMATFRFAKQPYYLLIDTTAEDDTNYLMSYIHENKSDITGEFVASPREELITTYALPYKGKEAYLYKIASTKKRLDAYLSETYPDISRSTWQKYIKEGYISVEGTIETSPKSDVSSAASVVVAIPEATDHESDTLPIIYLDESVIVINKPIGTLSHSKGALNDEFTVADFFRRYTTYNIDTNRPGIVHRLDRDTSGVMIGARTPEVASLLQKQFADRKTKKTYTAILSGILKEKEALIDLPIGRNPSMPSTFRVDAKGKSAVTKYAVIAEDAGKSLVELSPLTGRTHQLRVHMAYLHAPIYGDRVYGKAADRLYLHAHKLEITIPEGQRKVFSAPVPVEFTRIFPENL